VKLVHLKDKFFKLISKWNFWITSQFFLIFILSIIIYTQRVVQTSNIFEYLLILILTALNFHMGIYHYLGGPFDDNMWSIVILPLIVWSIVLFLISSIIAHKKKWKLLAILLIIFILLNFVSCSIKAFQEPLFFT